MLELISAFVNNYSQGRADSENQQSQVVPANSEHEEARAVTSRQVRTSPEQAKTGSEGRQRDSVELSREAEEIRKLQLRDQEVRAHEASHAAAGGAYAGAPSYTFQKGPDGKAYAVGGEVGIDVSPVTGDPQATLQKAQQIRAAALAPAEPSAKDMQVAQRAQAMATEARQELSSEMTELIQQKIDDNKSADEISGTVEIKSSLQPEPKVASGSFPGGMARLSIQA